jgi:hypothetical protein
MTNVYQFLQETLSMHAAPDARVVDVQARTTGAQGYSGAALHYYDVTYMLPTGNQAQITLVTKDAPLVERRVLALLNRQGQPNIPFSHTHDLITDAPALVCMQYVDGEQVAHAAVAPQAAHGLASIHSASLGQGEQLAWLPRADRSYFEKIVDTCWREPWMRTLANDELTDAYGNHWPRSAAEGNFSDEFGAYTQQLARIIHGRPVEVREPSRYS